jgi:hypothetical protein
MRKLAFSLILLFAVSAPLVAQTQRILPSQFGSWSGQPDVDAIETEAPIQWVNLWKEAGRTSGEYCHYSSGNKQLNVSLQAYRDPSGAYEYYTSQLSTRMDASTLGPGTAVDKNHLLALLGNFVLTVSPQRDVSEADLALLLKTVKAKAMKTPLPPMRLFLPSDGLRQGTQRYSLGPAGYQVAVKSLGREAYVALAPELGFSSGAEVMLADYMLKRPTSDVLPSEVLLLVEFPTPQLAEQQLHHIQPVLASRPEFAGTTVERNASLLSLVLSPSSEELAARLRKSINYETAVTWNEPSQTLTDPPWLLVLKTIFYAAGVFCAIAAVAGVLFGVFRLLMKRLFPGKVFDRSNSVELLQLGLNSKEINPDDFY